MMLARPLLGLTLLLSTAAAAQAPPGDGAGGAPPGGPPPQAFEACRGKQRLEPCSFQGRDMVTGTCREMGPNPVHCVPSHLTGEGPRPGGPGGQPGQPPRQGGAQPQPQPQGGPGPQGFEPRPNPAPKPTAGRLPDTGQATCFDASQVIDCPAEGQAFHGQDGHYLGQAPAYRDNGDGTVADLVTGLTWQKGHNAQRLSYQQAEAACRGLALGGHRDWRLPSIKELFSLADFNGATGKRHFIDKAFDLAPPGAEALRGDPFTTHTPEMMGQTWSSTLYAGQHQGRDVKAAFFFNFLDGRIKQAPVADGPTLFHRCVRGAEWGGNAFRDNRDGTVTDAASGLTWQKADDGRRRDWPAALAYCEGLKLAGHEDWRLPNVKELQSIVDYRRADPALDTGMFQQRDKDGWFWSSTTHGDAPGSAAYVCFGKCVSVDGVDFHGAGAQRSDPKTGDPAQWGPQGGQRDLVRITNYARCVRG